jgi:tetratricopeptide (TPR) repeat protein
MATKMNSQRHQLLENAEGFLELATVLEPDLVLSSSSRRKLAQRAIRHLEKIQNPMGHKPYVLFLKGQACRICEDHPGAICYLEQSRRIDPDNIHVYFALAWSYKRVNRLPEAIDCMQLAVEIDAESGIAQYNLACYLALDEQIELSLMHLSFAFDIDSKYREMAICETDFDLIRSDPRFASMTSVVV